MRDQGRAALSFQDGAPERYRLVTFEGAFHGRTLATIAAGGQAKHLEGFGPPVDGFDQVALARSSMRSRRRSARRPPVILIEPIMGEGGMREVSWRFLQDLRALGDEQGHPAAARRGADRHGPHRTAVRP